MENQSNKIDSPNADKVVLKLAGIEKEWVHAPDKGWVENRYFTDVSSEFEGSSPAQLISRKGWGFWKK
jgi:hypothetical protein